MSPRSSSDKEGSPVFYGRGGAGNVKKDTDHVAPPLDLGTPTLKSKTYTTGRGGTGNMAVNDPEHPELARERQDVDVPHVTLAVEKNFPTGRGGAGNIRTLTDEQRAAAKEHNQHVRANSKGRRNSRDRNHVRDLAEKGKEILFGHKDHKS